MAKGCPNLGDKNWSKIQGYKFTQNWPKIQVLIIARNSRREISPKLEDKNLAQIEGFVQTLGQNGG
jgi:hypothetical protein